MLDDATLLKALEMIGEADPLGETEYPDEATSLRHRTIHTLVRLSRLVLLGAPYQSVANDLHLARARIERIYGAPMPESSLGREPAPGEVECLNCRASATEERSLGIPVCADCGAAWDRCEWGEDLR